MGQCLLRTAWQDCAPTVCVPAVKVVVCQGRKTHRPRAPGVGEPGLGGVGLDGVEARRWLAGITTQRDDGGAAIAARRYKTITEAFAVCVNAMGDVHVMKADRCVPMMSRACIGLRHDCE